jgi:tripartite-type tricarboxylate transporter receptor subunit TctC
MIDRRRFIASSCGLVAATFPADAWSQPAHKLARIVVGFPPGGSLDAVARLLSGHLKEYAETVIVENRGGAGGRLALEGIKKAPADGTIMVLTPGDQLGLFPHIYKDLSYDPVHDFEPVSGVCTVHFLLIIGPMVPDSVRTLQSFIDWCRDNPKLANFGTGGTGTRPHFMGELFARAAGFSFVHVPYKGGVLAVQDVLAGHLAANVSVITTTLPNLQAGKLRALMTSAPARSAALPDVPTARELGYPSLEASEVFGVLLPRGTDPAMVLALNAAIRQALANDEVRQGLAKLGLEPAPSGPQEYASLIKSDLKAWSGIVRASGFNPIE